MRAPAPGRPGFAADEGGAALIEFALVVPILFALLAGCYEIGRTIAVRQAMLDAIRSGARTLARSPDPVCRGACPPPVEAVVAASRTAIARDGRVPPADVTVSPGWDGERRIVALTARVRFGSDLLGFVGLGPILTLQASQREAWIAP